MTQDPTPYDLLQDAAIEGLQDIVTPYYTPPGDVEYSFPVVGQGITADQYQQMSLAQGDGVLHRGYTPYYLRGHSSDSETNSRNTLILDVDSRTGIAESIIGGYYHRLTEQMELSFPPVTTPTTYYVCVTRDPRREEEPTGPVHIEVYAGEPPTTHGRQHIITNTVHREPNQLLSQATITRYRQFIAPTIAVQNDRQLPDLDDVLHGTIAFSGYEGSGGIHFAHNDRWRNMLIGEWRGISLENGWVSGSPAVRVRRTPLGVQMRGYAAGWDANNSRIIATLPEGYRPSLTTRIRPVFRSTTTATNEYLEVTTDGQITFNRGQAPGDGTRVNQVDFDGVIIPLD